MARNSSLFVQLVMAAYFESGNQMKFVKSFIPPDEIQGIDAIKPFWSNVYVKLQFSVVILRDGSNYVIILDSINLE